MGLKAKKTDDSIIIQTWEQYEFKLFPGSKSTKPYLHFLFLNPETGKEKRIRKLAGLKPGSSLAALKKEAKQMVPDLVDLLSKGWNPIANTCNDLPVTPISPIIDCIDYWLKHREEQKANNAIAKKTLENNYHLMNYFKDWLKSKNYSFRKANTFTYLDINSFMQTTAKARVWNKVSYNTYRTDIGTFFKYLVALKVLNENPVLLSESKNTKKDSSRFVIFEESELIEVVTTLEKDKSFLELYIACKILFYLNIRPVEITRIQVYNIDFEKRLLTLEPSKTKNGNEAKWQLTDELFILLRDYLKDTPANYFAFANHNTPKPVQANEDFLGQRWRAFRKKYKISSHLKFYALKHSSDWYDLENGVSLQKISERNRHSNPNVTVAYIEQRLNKKIIQPSLSTRF
ncbi:tyrosine-type recombinase/integrase [Mucilaginibacter sp.]|uniref:tyrosine-type recombinase/integrase n=1 Tax=Mucilaginibacter sp. TaxID=1882438 RepID=UPI003D120724